MLKLFKYTLVLFVLAVGMFLHYNQPVKWTTAYTNEGVQVQVPADSIIPTGWTQ